MRKVLLYHHNETKRKKYLKVLSEEGYEITDAANGKAMLNMLNKLQVDIIFISLIGMDAMDAHELFMLRIKTLKHGIPIVVLARCRPMILNLHKFPDCKRSLRRISILLNDLSFLCKYDSPENQENN